MLLSRERTRITQMTNSTLAIVFVIAWMICTIISVFSRGAMNNQNIENYGTKADYNSAPSMAIVGSAVAGAIYAAILTAIVWFALG